MRITHNASHVLLLHSDAYNFFFKEYAIKIDHPITGLGFSILKKTY